jgi:ankyrin repeat protein
LEDELEQLSYTLEPFSEEDQVEFLTKFWSLNDRFTKMDKEEKEKIKNNLVIYAKKLIKELRDSISDKDRKFSVIPLQTRMLAEAFEEQVKKFCQTDESMTELKFQLDMVELYRRFIERKYDIYLEEKLRVQVDNVGTMEQRESDIPIMRKDHQLLALRVLFTKEQATLFESNSQCTFSKEKLTRIGVVQINDDGKPHFIHRTFAEYYVADCLVNSWTEGSKTSEQEQDFILKDIFQEDDYRVIRVFVDGFLSKQKPSEEMLKQYGSRIDDLRNDCLLHRAALEGNANIIEFLLNSAMAGGHKDTASRLLVGQDTTKRTAWYVAAESGELDILQKIWDVAKDNLTKQKIEDGLLLATDQYGNTAWHGAVAGGNVDVLVKMWDFAKHNLTTLEIINKLLLAKGDRGNTALHLAAKMGKLDVLQKLWDLAKHTLTKEEIINDFLLAKNAPGNTAWHLAAGYSKKDELQQIWNWAKNHLTKEEIKNKLLLSTDRVGKTVWHMVADTHELDILYKLWEWAKDNLTTEEIKNNWVLATNRRGQTSWQRAAYWGRQDILQIIWDLAKDNITKEEKKNKLLLAADIDGNTCWHMAAEQCKQDALHKTWDLSKHILTTEEIQWVLLSATNKNGETVWNIAEHSNEGSILQKIRDLTKDSLT